MTNVYCKSAKLIVCLLDRGQSHAVLGSLNESAHVLASEYVSIRHLSGMADNFECNEVDLLRIVVAPEHAEKLFEELYYLADIGNNKCAFMYQVNAPKATPYELPNIPQQGVLVSALQQGETFPEGMDEKAAKDLIALVGLDKS